MILEIKGITLGDNLIGKITEQEAVELVNQVIRAQLQIEDHDAEIRLEKCANGVQAIGQVYKDKKGRFADGDMIYTSLVQSFETMNSKYKVIV